MLMANIDYLVKSRILCSFKMDVQSVSIKWEKCIADFTKSKVVYLW